MTTNGYAPVDDADADRPLTYERMAGDTAGVLRHLDRDRWLISMIERFLDAPVPDGPATDT
jgi:hypothetical protein